MAPISFRNTDNVGLLKVSATVAVPLPSHDKLADNSSTHVNRGLWLLTDEANSKLAVVVGAPGPELHCRAFVTRCQDDFTRQERVDTLPLKFNCSWCSQVKTPVLLFFKCSATLPNELSFFLYDSPAIVFLAKLSTTSQPDDGLQTKTRGNVNPRGAKCLMRLHQT